MQRFHEYKLNPTDFSKLFRISRKTIYDWERKGVIKAKLNEDEKKPKKLYSFEDILSARSQKPYPLKQKKVFAFTNVKGGTGKSTLSTQFLMRASMYGLKCLAIDLDPQAHLTYQLGFKTEENTPIIHDTLINKIPIQDVIQKVTPTLDIIPSTIRLAITGDALFQQTRREYILQEALETVKDNYDIIVADTNPAISVLNISMYLASDEIAVVCATDFLSFHGLKVMFDQLKKFKSDFKKDLPVKVIPNLFDVRDGICQESLGAIRKYYGDYITNIVVRKNTQLREASKLRNSIFLVRKNSSGAEDIEALTEELLN